MLSSCLHKFVGGLCLLVALVHLMQCPADCKRSATSIQQAWLLPHTGIAGWIFAYISLDLLRLQ
jgi:hypothetical protein